MDTLIQASWTERVVDLPNDRRFERHADRLGRPGCDRDAAAGYEGQQILPAYVLDDD
jgi:hypothetical protein